MAPRDHHGNHRREQRGARHVLVSLPRRAVVLALSSCLLASCSAATPEDAAGPEPSRVEHVETPANSGQPGPASTPEAASPSARDDRTRLPKTPATRRPAALAGQLELAAATLRRHRAAAADLRRAGELQQLATRVLAAAPASFRREVIGGLGGETAMVTRAGVRAARLLGGMTGAQETLPRWRIVSPPPPGVLLGHYRAAQRRSGVGWSYLAAIHLVETRMGRIRGTSTAGARGPMQFLPSTWELYGAGGDIRDPRDAILAAARLLKANGAPGDMARALWHYNPSESYVRAVSAYARTIRRADWAYRGYWHWRVLYRHTRGTYVLPVGYPEVRPIPVSGS